MAVGFPTIGVRGPVTTPKPQLLWRMPSAPRETERLTGTPVSVQIAALGRDAGRLRHRQFPQSRDGAVLTRMFCGPRRAGLSAPGAENGRAGAAPSIAADRREDARAQAARFPLRRGWRAAVPDISGLRRPVEIA